MDSGDLLEKNVNQWLLTCPKEAAGLADFRCAHLQLCETEGKEKNIKRQESGKSKYYHAKEGALEEAKKWFESLNLYNISSLFVYGVGLGYYYIAAKEWLKESSSRSLIFLEDDLEVIRLLLETEQGSELLFDKQVRLQYFLRSSEKEEEVESTLLSIPLYYFIGDIQLSALDFYAKQKGNDFKFISLQLEYIKNCRLFQIMEYMNYGGAFFKNFYRNMLSLPEACLSEKMLLQFEGVPAIICGAGPSLEKQLPLLEALKERALIFSGGSAINTLGVDGLLPHFGVSLDPNWNQYARLFMNQAYEVPFFYRNRIFPQALSLIQGERLYVQGSGGHQIANYFEEKLGIKKENPISEGNNVVNFSISIAEALGCNPIILVGVDHAYTDKRSYSPGVVPHPIFDAGQEVSTRSENEDVISYTDIYGQPIATLWKWVEESFWIANFAVSRPQIKFLNATEGGIGIDGVPNVSFEETVKKYLDIPFDLSGYIHGEIQNAKMPESVNKENILSLMKELKESLQRCKECCSSLRQEFHKVLKKIKETGQAPEDMITEKAFRMLKALNEEPAYEKVLNVFNRGFIIFYGQRNRPSETEAEDWDLSSVGLIEKRTSMNKRRYNFLKTVCSQGAQSISEAFDVDKITNLLMDVFKKEADNAKTVEEKTPPFFLKEPLYQVKEGSFQIKDDELKIAFEEELVRAPVVESYGMKDFVFSKEKHPLHGCYRLLYPSGALKMELYYKEGKLHGPSVYYSESGKILAKTWFVDGEKEGRASFYYSDGKVHSIQRFKKSKWTGNQEFYYPDGRSKSTLTYDVGLLHGISTLFYPDGLKKRQMQFSRGKRNGREILWNIGGIKEFSGNYHMGKPVGVFKAWHPFGTISREFRYDQEGSLVDVKGWDIDGNPLPKEAILKKDYFEVVREETEHLTDSLEKVFKEFNTFTVELSEIDKKKESRLPDFTEDMVELKKEIENLRSLNDEMEEAAETVSESTGQALWKTPEAKRFMGKRMKEATAKMAEDIESMGEIMQMTLKFIKKKKEETPEREK